MANRISAKRVLRLRAERLAVSEIATHHRVARKSMTAVTEAASWVLG